MISNPLTEAEKALARHALGLPNAKRRSQHNAHFVAARSDAHAIWADLEARHFARRYPVANGATFVLTRAGADRALVPGETLDPEDFPTLGQD